MSVKTLFILLSFLIISPCAAYAGGFCCQMPTGVQEEGTGSAGRFSLRADYSYSRMSRFYEGGSQVSLSSVLDDPRFTNTMVPGSMMGVVPESMDMQRITLSAAYAPAQRIRLILSVPWVINDMTMLMFMDPDGMGPMPGMWESEKMEQISDLGDVTLTGTYRIYQDRDEMPTAALSLGAGLKFPTGKSTVTNSNRKRIHAHMQPGTGSWDPILVLGFMKMLSPDFLIQADARYEFATANNLGYEFGDTFALNGYLKYNLADFMNLSLGFNYFHAEQSDDPQNKYNGRSTNRLTDYVGYTGEDSIWVSPGLQVLPLKGLSVDFRFQYPLYYHVPDIEQVTDYRLVAGVSYNF